MARRVIVDHVLVGSIPTFPSNGGVVLAGTRPACNRQLGVRLPPSPPRFASMYYSICSLNSAKVEI